MKYYYYSIILCLYTHWRENVVMSKEVISSASKLLICSITTTGYGCHMVGHSSVCTSVVRVSVNRCI